MLVMNYDYYKLLKRGLLIGTTFIIALLGFFVLHFYGAVAYLIFIIVSCVLSYRSGLDLADYFLTVYRINEGVLYITCRNKIVVVEGIKIKKETPNKLYITFKRVIKSTGKVNKRTIILNKKAYSEKGLHEFIKRIKE